MNKKLLAAAAIVAMLLGLTACGSKESNDSSVSETEQVTEAETTAEATEEATEEETESEEEASDESAEETEFEIPEIEFTPVDGLSENYADLENRGFAYDGKIFTLGESTLQDLIDGGIPFSEDELNNVGNNVNKNYETGTYNARINDYVSMQFSFMNNTDSNITESECLLSTVRWYILYVPQPDYDQSMNDEIISYLSDAAKKVCFSFPLNLTKEQLLENNSDTTEEDEYNNVEYKVDSEVYYGSSGYSFEFNKTTNQLENVYITWLP